MEQDERSALRAARNRALGRYGEEQVALLYESRGFTVVCRNYYTRYGEIDIILERPEKKLYVFCEVKLRSSELARPCDAVTRSKIEKLRKTAALFYRDHDRDFAGRFDVAEVYCKSVGGRAEINLMENAFM